MIDFNKIIKNKKLVGYAAGASFLGTASKYRSKIEYLIDDTPDIGGKTIDGVSSLNCNKYESLSDFKKIDTTSTLSSHFLTHF